MKVIIAGSRDINDYRLVEEAILESPFYVEEVVCGMARGVDLIGESWAIKTSTPVRKFYAKWNELGKMAGHVRNKEMADYADALIAVWDGKSSGTKNMILTMERLNKPVFVWMTRGRGEMIACNICGHRGGCGCVYASIR